MIGNLALAVASAAGARVSAGKAGQLAGMFTKEQLVAQIGSKATYDVLMNILEGTRSQQKQRPTARRTPQESSRSHALELKGFLRKVDKPTDFLKTLEKYPLNRVRAVLADD